MEEYGTAQGEDDQGQADAGLKAHPAATQQRGQRRRQRDELPELVVWGRHAGKGRAAEGAQGGSLLLAVAEDEGEAGDAALVFGFWVFFMTKRERAK